MGIVSYMQGEYLNAIEHWTESKKVFEEVGDKAGMANILSNLGAIYFNQGDDANALDYYLQALKISEEINDSLRLATVCINIGGVYYNKVATHNKAIEYYLKGIKISENIGALDVLGTALANVGEIYFVKQKNDSALMYLKKAVAAQEGSENIPYTLNLMGKVYAKQGEFEKALQNQEEAYEIAKNLGAQLDVAQSLVSIAKTHQQQGEANLAIKYFTQAKDSAIILNANAELKDAYQGLSESYGKLADYSNAYKYQTLLLNIKDTLYNIETDKKLGTLSFTYELDKKEGEISLLTKDKELQQQEIRRQKLVRNGFIGGFAIVALFASIFLKQRIRIAKEKKRSDELLLNILPAETAEELKATGSAKAKSFDLISVLFTDFKNFTQAAEKLTPEELVAEINSCYSEFDKIVTRHNIEKIKTIGDAYMCAGGLPVKNETHAHDVVKAGLEMQQFIEKNKIDREAKGLPFFELRLGIHTGPAVAGIVGIKKFAYDIWGDTVNTASRMESSGEVGKVNISGTTYELIKNSFHCIHRGKVQAKNKGEIDMYFVQGLK
ncbi:MAG: tetratricopeptide repeat protein [Bacteroidetes bacterium]|nr:tetratricopeptide repeat protein [Bacteroidota bacterium]